MKEMGRDKGRGWGTSRAHAVAHARSSSSIRFLRTASSGVTRGMRCFGLPSGGDGVTGSNADAVHRERLAESDASMLSVLQVSPNFGAAPQLAVRRGGNVGLVGLGGGAAGSSCLNCSGGVLGSLTGVLFGAIISV